MRTLNGIYDIAEQNKVGVYSFSLTDTESMSYMSRSGKCYIAIDPFQLDSECEEKIKLAHELGHCVQGAFYNVDSAFV